MERGWMDVARVANLFVVSKSAVRRWGRDGRFGAKKMGRRWYFETAKVLSSWLPAVSDQYSSTDLPADLCEFLDLVEDLDSGDAAGLEEETQHEIAELARKILATRGSGESDFARSAVLELARVLRGNPWFDFLARVPVPIQ